MHHTQSDAFRNLLSACLQSAKAAAADKAAAAPLAAAEAPALLPVVPEEPPQAELSLAATLQLPAGPAATTADLLPAEPAPAAAPSAGPPPAAQEQQQQQPQPHPAAAAGWADEQAAAAAAAAGWGDIDFIDLADDSEEEALPPQQQLLQQQPQQEQQQWAALPGPVHRQVQQPWGQPYPQEQQRGPEDAEEPTMSQLPLAQRRQQQRQTPQPVPLAADATDAEPSMSQLPLAQRRQRQQGTALPSQQLPVPLAWEQQQLQPPGEEDELSLSQMPLVRDSGW